ncbi:glycosyltransferase family 4 protein [Akkermansiaceae bacterium]|nr:glycosyltransferase family 4 protein [Akkermansiaceae bacterium]MDA7887864.1 glycosyltransferase family 4 protein [Akkermansiaceae bacterium]MDB4544807.1 glycosyltransferase family 4 protein [Akkermansiaceae bacterium]
MSESLKRLLIVGQTPPPWHGQGVATKMLVDHEWSDWEVDFVRMAYSDGIDAVGKFQWRKIGHLFQLTREVRQKLKASPGTVMLYPPSSAHWLPFLRDVYFLIRTRKLARGTAFIFHASGLPAFVKKSRLRSWLARLAYHGADISLEVAQEKITAKEVFGARESAWCPCAAEIPELPPKPSRNRHVCTALFVGSLMEGKGVFEILRTAKVMKDGGMQKVRFVIVGKWSDQDFQRECKTFVEEHELGEWVDFRGQLTGDAKWEAFREADLFFFPSHYSSEASPIVLMEALGAGLPVVSTLWAGIPAMVGECEAVNLCAIQKPEEFAEAISLTIRNREEASRLSVVAEEFFRQRYTPEHFIKRIEAGLAKAGL